jgi:hypothetical protein
MPLHHQIYESHAIRQAPFMQNKDIIDHFSLLARYLALITSQKKRRCFLFRKQRPFCSKAAISD